jgi:toxin ParE1/3/4
VRIRFTDSARTQFLAGLAYIHEDRPSAAVRVRKRAELALRRLAQFPESGRVIPEFPELPYREVLVPPFRFFYLVRGETVWIVAVWHSAQMPEKSLE